MGGIAFGSAVPIVQSASAAAPNFASSDRRLLCRFAKSRGIVGLGGGSTIDAVLTRDFPLGAATADSSPFALRGAVETALAEAAALPTRDETVGFGSGRVDWALFGVGLGGI